MEQKVLIDLTLLSLYDELLKGVITAKETALNTKIGTLPEGHANVIAYINAQIESVNGDAGKLEARVAANEEAIGHKAEGEQAATGLYKYTDDAAKDAVAEIVGGATADFDTLQEVEAWIKDNKDGAAKMVADIEALKGTNLDTSASNSIVGAKKYAEEKVAGKNVSAEGENGENALVEADAQDNGVVINSTQKLKNAVALAETSVQTVTKATSVENYVSMTVVDGDDATVGIDDAALVEKLGAAKNGETAATGMYADIQGATNATVKDVEDMVNSIVLATEDNIRGLFA